jgi:hypothetical protein
MSYLVEKFNVFEMELLHVPAGKPWQKSRRRKRVYLYTYQILSALLLLLQLLLRRRSLVVLAVTLAAVPASTRLLLSEKDNDKGSRRDESAKR